MSDTGIVIDSEAFSRDVGQFALLTGRSFGEELKEQGRGVLRELLRVTPPFNQHNKSVSSARKAGAGAIRRDLAGGGHKRGQRRVGVFAVLRDATIDQALDTGVYEDKAVKLFVRKDGSVWATETNTFKPSISHAEMRSHHQRYFKNGKMSSAGSYERNIGRWRFIDQLVIRRSTFESYLQKMERRVGFLGGGFAAAAAGLRVGIPGFMRRHSAAPGGLEMQLEGDDLYIVIENKVRYASQLADLVRRVDWAIRAQQRKMERQVPFLLRRHERLVN
jgi:hypothetical protein